MSIFDSSNDLPPAQNLSMVIGTISETDPSKDTQNGYDIKVSQLSPSNSKIKSPRYMYLRLTMRYIRVITEMGFFCMIDLLNAVVQKRELRYPNTFDLSRRHWVTNQICHQIEGRTSLANVIADQPDQFQKHRVSSSIPTTIMQYHGRSYHCKDQI